MTTPQNVEIGSIISVGKTTLIRCADRWANVEEFETLCKDLVSAYEFSGDPIMLKAAEAVNALLSGFKNAIKSSQSGC